MLCLPGNTVLYGHLGVGDGLFLRHIFFFLCFSVKLTCEGLVELRVDKVMLSLYPECAKCLIHWHQQVGPKTDVGRILSPWAPVACVVVHHTSCVCLALFQFHGLGHASSMPRFPLLCNGDNYCPNLFRFSWVLSLLTSLCKSLTFSFHFYFKALLLLSSPFEEMAFFLNLKDCLYNRSYGKFLEYHECWDWLIHFIVELYTR